MSIPADKNGWFVNMFCNIFVAEKTWMMSCLLHSIWFRPLSSHVQKVYITLRYSHKHFTS